MNKLNKLKDFENWCNSHNIDLTETQLKQFEMFKENLINWNKKFNLTAITDDIGIWQKHFADSLTLLPYIPQNDLKLIDIGSGAGFPGIPLKIMLPSVDTTLLDSLRKRIYFLEDTVKHLGLTDVKCIHSRAEDFAKTNAKQYDICTARAVAHLSKLCAWCLPFLKHNGIFVAMKGPDPKEELKEALPVIQAYNCEVVEIKKVEIVPNLVHSIVVIKNKK